MAPCSISYHHQTLYHCLSSLRLITFAGHSAHLAYLVHKSGRKTSIIIICTIAYQIIFSGVPSYLFSVLSVAPKPRALCSSGFHLFSVPRVKTHAGTRAFLVALPSPWNSLLEHVTSSISIVSFCHHLKTHPFRLAYNNVWFYIAPHSTVLFWGTLHKKWLD